ncbi:MAG TPA: SbcC/MukB-like Walker B domain-containing protein [Tepidisphaeraceae bacterium]|jgi:uncharacterized protein YPO0396|nr:SbcC/MukB-like Walker B domain-containing protein [Tepidisphaeraceae bacterium]
MLISETANNGFHPPPGFRLRQLEVRNWGTFHEKVHVLDPAGQTALLLGENGSGKSTLVDALLTLLVPRVKRNYNLSAGSTKKKERDEKTYVLGAYGSQSGSEESRAQTKYLRKAGSPPSILLAAFKNDATGEAITLAQILWIQEDDVRKLFLVSRSERSIQKDFSGLGESRTWKKAFRHKGFEVEDSFSEYAEKVVRYLHMESTTTLALFSQTVAIKEITHLSGFIRDHMLEKLDAKELVDGLERHYQDLKACWEAIRTAKKQLELLSPIVEKAAEITRFDEEMHAAAELRDALPACFASRRRALLEAEQLFLAEEIRKLDLDIKNLTDTLEDLKRQEFDLKQTITNDEVGKQLTRVQEELDAIIETEKERRALAVQYHECLSAIGMKEEVNTEPRFSELQRWAENEQAKQSDIISNAADEKATAEQQFKEIQNLHRSLDDELRSLRARRDLIPERQRRIRLIIAQGAGVDAADLPFAGELMDVKPEYQAQWRGALERLLRSFGLSLLVPEDLYPCVNRFINDNNLRDRVVYHPVPGDVPTFQPSHDKGRAIELMQLKDGHSLSSWVGRELRMHFNYRCCESIEEFENASGFALTRQGLIRGAGTLHIKDDRTAINDPSNHILGWSNRDKILRLEEEQDQLAAAGQKQVDIITDAGRRKNNAIARAGHAARLQGFRVFTEVDWRSAASRRGELETQKLELEKSSDKIKKLREQLAEVKKQIADKDAAKTEKAGRRGGFQSREEENGRGLEECKSVLAATREADLACFDSAFAELLADTELTIANAWVTQTKAETAISKKLLDLSGLRGKLVDATTRAMGMFLGEYRDLSNLSAGEEYIADFLRFEESVRRDDLPRHDQKFQELMSGDVLVHVANFQDALQDHCEEIQSKIAHLNSALKSIKYSERTYITIRASHTADSDVRTFRGRLKGCLDYGLAPDGAARDTTFQRISDLIDLFRAKPDWTTKVTDTRNWLAFAVEELDRETGKQENIYEDTSGKSGGQKAKLAFTILASAVAYQYGIAKDRDNPESFRFVVVDEMFSRSDETNSRYALQLFAQFHLQLLIVCPFDARARVVEPFVSSYHLALNPTTQFSTVRTVSVEEVREHLARQAPVQSANANA